MLHTLTSGQPPGPQPRTVHIILESPSPIGPSIRRLSHSNCIVTTFPRNALHRVACWPELDRPGIYVLVAPSVGDFALRTFVGQASNLLQSVRDHERNRLSQRDIQIITIASTDNQLHGDVVQYTEQRLIWTLNETRLVEIDNHSSTCPVLPADIRIRAERFFQDALLLLGPVEPMMGLVAATIAGQERKRSFGNDVRPQHVNSFPGEQLYELKQGRCHAFAIKSLNRTVRVLAGAMVATEVNDTLSRRSAAFRRRLIADGSLVHSPEAGTFILTRDIEVSSPAGAADLVTGRRMDWGHGWLPAQNAKEAGDV